MIRYDNNMSINLQLLRFDHYVEWRENIFAAALMEIRNVQPSWASWVSSCNYKTRVFARKCKFSLCGVYLAGELFTYHGILVLEFLSFRFVL